ncbi:MAG: DUF4430 domain-containing protein [Firmicutes bacterium]|nr:DUF4430 domain-containing protein [Bacillota bacterium]
MKKLLSVFLILILCFALGACAAPSDDGLEEIENPMTVYISFADATDDDLEVTGLKEIKKTEFYAEEGSTVFEATQVFLINNNLDYQLSSDGTYLESMLGFTESDFDKMAGWIYEVNGEMVMMSASECEVKEGDVITWEFRKGM